MTTHHFQPTRYYNAIGQYEPVLRVKDGDTIVTTTIDAGGSDQHNQQVANRGNPMTGPFYVEGAEPGDTLVVYLDRLFPNREIGYVSNRLAPVVVDPDYVHKLPHSEEWRCDWRIDGEAETASIIKPGSKLDNLALPLKPMLGCFGVAPERDQSISTATSGPHGGNMDYRGFVEGVTVYFPVSTSGALFYLGDGHAIQGDGEIAGTGIEISFDVQFTLSVMKGKRIYWPRGENADYIFTAGNARPLDQALQHATTEMSRWLEEDYGLDGTDIGVLMGQCVEYDLGNMFDPAYTMICKMSKQLLSRIK